MIEELFLDNTINSPKKEQITLNLIETLEICYHFEGSIQRQSAVDVQIECNFFFFCSGFFLTETSFKLSNFNIPKLVFK